MQNLQFLLLFLVCAMAMPHAPWRSLVRKSSSQPRYNPRVRGIFGRQSVQTRDLLRTLPANPIPTPKQKEKEHEDKVPRIPIPNQTSMLYLEAPKQVEKDQQ